MQEDQPSFYSKAKAIFKDPRKESIGNNPLFSKNTAIKFRKVELEVAGDLATFGLEDIVNETLVHSYSVQASSLKALYVCLPVGEIQKMKQMSEVW